MGQCHHTGPSLTRDGPDLSQPEGKSCKTMVLKNIICVHYLLQTLHRKTLLLCATRKCSNKITICIIDGAVVALLRRSFVYLCLKANQTASHEIV